jgi:hypothetical protein
MQSKTLTIGSVFVPGGQPVHTYNPRKASNLENRLLDYLDSPFKILSLTGATKSGKTVLARKNLSKEQAIWVSGGQIESPEDLWNKIVDTSDSFNETAEVNTISNTSSDSRKLNASAKVAGFGGGVGTDHTQANARGQQQSQSRKTKPIFTATNFLIESKTPLVIDDFHYIDSDTQLQIVRSLKDCVFEGVPVVIIAVPHRAYDAVRVEKEMTGRVQQLEIPPWEADDLSQIANLGFNVLNLDVADSIVDNLVLESFKSPHIIQEFCLTICRVNEIREGATKENRRALKPPKDWVQFYRNKASQMGRKEFERLARGPRQRSDRKTRYFKNGEQGDIYRAVLYAISKVGAKDKLEYEEVRTGLKEVLSSEIPTSQEVGRVLEKMSGIAREHIEGEPVLDWDKEYSTLYLSDPFFAYYLKWGAYIQG